MEQPRVLIVDDLQRDLDRLARALGPSIRYELAFCVDEAIERLRAGSFDLMAVCLRLATPGMVDHLVKFAREFAPAVQRIGLATSDSFRQVRARMAREGWARLLPLPYEPEELRTAIDELCRESQEVFRAQRVQRESIDRIVAMLGEVLASSAPHLFARGMRLHRRATTTLADQPESLAWPVRCAALLSQLGLTLIPPGIGDKLNHGDFLTAPEVELLDRVPELSARMLEGLPGLEEVRELVRRQREPLAALPPLGARLLNVLSELDVLESRGLSLNVALAKLGARSQVVDLAVLTMVARGEEILAPRKVRVAELRVGMVIGEDVRTGAGLLVAARGSGISDNLLGRITSFHQKQALRQPIEVLIRREPSEVAPDARTTTLPSPRSGSVG